MRKRLLSILLSVAILATSTGTDVFAAENVQTENQNQEILSEEADSDGLTALEKQLQDLVNGEQVTDESDHIDEEPSVQIEEDSDTEPLENVLETDESEETTLQIPELEELLEYDVITKGDWEYYVDNEIAHIVRYIGDGKSEVTIPTRIDGHIVSSIGAHAFEENCGISNVFISFYITSIDDNAFDNTGVTISSRFGSYATTYAKNHGLKFTNLSELDFADGVLDMTEIIRSHFDMLSDTSISMNSYEADLLPDGSVFYLPPCEEVPNGDGYKVISKEYEGSKAIIYIERALGAEVLNRLVISNVGAQADWDNAVFFFDTDGNGIYEEYTKEDAIESSDGGYLLQGDDDQVLGWQYGSSLSHGVNVSFKIPLSKKEAKWSKSSTYLSAKAGVNVVANTDIDIDFARARINKFDISLDKETTVKASLASKTDYSENFNTKTAKNGDKCRKEIPLAIVPLQSTGIETIEVVVSMVLEVTGELSLSFKYKGTQGYSYNTATGKFDKVDKTYDRSWKMGAKIELKWGLKAELKFIALGLVEASLGVEAGLDIEVSGEASLGDGALPDFGNLADISKYSASIEVKFYIEVGIEVNIGPEDYRLLSFAPNLVSFEVTLWKCELQPVACTVHFILNEANIADQVVQLGGQIAEPDVSSIPRNAKGQAIIGWTKDTSTNKLWDFDNDNAVADKDSQGNYFINLYPVWGEACKVTFIMDDDSSNENSGLVVSSKYYTIGSLIEEPEEPMEKNYKFYGWYKEKAHRNKWNFDSDTAQGKQLVIHGWNFYQKGYDPWAQIEADAAAAGDFEYTVYGSNATITNYKGNGGVVRIPQNIGAYTVTSIKKGAFNTNGSKIKELIMPKTITYFYPDDVGVLAACSKLEKLTTAAEAAQSASNSRFYYLFGSYSNNIPSTLKKVTYIGSRVSDSSFGGYNSIEEIVLGPEVTHIGVKAFNGCSALRKVTFQGDNCSYFGDYAFCDCSSLESIDMPKSWTLIGEYSFYGCRSLKTIKMSPNVKQIAGTAFNGCSSVKELVIPDSCGLIMQGALSGMSSLEKLTTPREANKSGSSKGFIYFFGSDYGKVPSTLKTVVITGAQDTYLDDKSFYRCTGIESITIGGNIKSFNGSPFTETAIKELTIPGTVQLQSKGVPKTLEKLTVTGTSVCDYMIYGYPNLKKIILSDSIKTIGNQAIKAPGITELKLPASLTSIGTYAFSGCSSMKSFTFPSNFTQIPAGMFSGWTSLENVTLHKNITAIGDSAFNGCESLSKITIPAKVKSIGQSAFYGCKALTDIQLPSGITSIGTRTFCGCSSLRGIDIPKSVTSIGEYAFSSCPLIGEITIPEGVTSIGAQAFGGCTGLTELSIPAATTSIGESTFKGTHLKNLYIMNASAMKKSSLSGVDVENLHICGGNTIACFAAQNCPEIKRLYISGAVKTIDYYAFEGCKNLEYVELEEGIETISYRAFQNCPNLKTAIIPSSVKTVWDCLFNGDTSLSSLYYYSDAVRSDTLDGTNKGTLTIYGLSGSKAGEFYKKLGYKFVAIDGEPEEGDFAVIKDGQAKVVWMDGIFAKGHVSGETVGMPISAVYEPFARGKEVAGWYLDSTCTVPWNMSRDVVPLEGMTLYADWQLTKEYEDDFAFEINDDGATITGYWGNEAYLSIPDKIGGKSVVAIDSGAFANLPNLYRVMIPSTVQSIGSECFAGSTALYQIMVSGDNKYFCSDDGVLFDKEKKKLICYPQGKICDKYVVNDGIETIGDSAFTGSSVVEVVLPQSLRVIGKAAFMDCSELESLVLPYSNNGIESIGDFALWGCSNVVVKGASNQIVDRFIATNNVKFNVFKLRFIDDGGDILTLEVKSDESPKAQIDNVATMLEKDGYTIAGYRINNAEGECFDVNSGTMGLNDLTLYVERIPDYAYELIEEGSTNIVLTKYNGIKKDVVIPDKIDGHVVAKIGKDIFAGNNIMSVSIPNCVSEIEDGAIAEDTTIIADGDSYAMEYAVSKGIDHKYRKYKLEFNSNGGSQIQAYNYAKGENIASNPVPVRDNYEFAGWYFDESLTTPWTAGYIMPAKNVTLYAKWNIKNANLKDISFEYDMANVGTQLSPINGYVITAYTGTDKDVIIPSKINGVDVVGIQQGAFENNISIKSVMIPDSVKRIGENAFRNCTSLEIVDFGKNISNIGDSAFMGCTALYEADMAALSYLYRIPDSCFAYDEMIMKVKLPTNLDVIGKYAFAGCRYIQNIDIPSGVETIEDYAFCSDRMLQALNIPASTTRIGVGIVDHCDMLTAINLAAQNSVYRSIDGVLYKGNELIRWPVGKSGNGVVQISEGIDSIADYAFAGCYGIDGIQMSSSVNELGIGAFSDCTNLISFAFSAENKVVAIPDDAFSGCVSLTSIDIPENLTKIGDTSFAFCSELPSLTVGRKVTSFGLSPFIGAEKLMLFGYPYSGLDEYAQNAGLTIKYINGSAETPSAPKVLSVGADYVELVPVAGCEYSYDGGKWQSSPRFEGLSNFSEYVFRQRIVGTRDLGASSASEGVKVIIGKKAGFAAKAPVIIDVGPYHVNIAPVEGCEYSIDGVKWQDSPIISGLNPLTNYICYQRSKETSDESCGNIASKEFTTSEEVSVTVSYSAVSGSVDASSKDVILGEKYGKLPVAVRAGYKFNGWFTNSSCSEAYRIDENSTVSNSKSHTIYAGWVAGSTTDISFHIDDDASFEGDYEEGTPITYAYGEPIASMPVAIRENYDFAGWYTAPEGGQKVSEQDIMSFANNTSLYSQWLRKNDQNGEIAGSSLVARSISLNDVIGINYYFTINEDLESELNNLCVDYELKGLEHMIPIEENMKVTLADGREAYKITIDLAAAEVNERVKVYLAYVGSDSSSKNTKDYSYSVKEYCEALIAEDNNDEYEELAKRIMGYGDFAKGYFAGNVVESTDRALIDSIDANVFDEYRYDVNGNQEGLNYVGSSLVLKSKCAIRHYFSVDNNHRIEDYLFLLDDGRVLRPVEASGMYYVEINNIDADELDHAFKLTVGNMTISYSALSYAQKAVTKASDKQLIDVVKSLYLYNQAAKKYWEKYWGSDPGVRPPRVPRV